jgi:uncharacterized membrane protein YoaK (UPF0700 family)
VTAGCVDLICYFTLVHIFTAHMSGNTVVTAAYIETGKWNDAILHALPIPCFALGVVVGVIIDEARPRVRRRTGFAPVLALEAILLVIFAILAFRLTSESARPVSVLFGFALAMPVTAMGLQNATLRRIGSKSVRTTFVTGMLTDFAEYMTKAVLKTGPLRSALISGSMWLAYLIGAAAGGLLDLRIGSVSILLPAAILVVLAIAEAKSWL